MSERAIDIPLNCGCGRVQGVARNVTPRGGTRLVCYCDDCQAFARYLERDDILNAYGGTDIFQLAPAQVAITRGEDALRCMRLSSGGLFRWYAGCCNTPIGNTMSARVPYVGMIHNFMDDDGVRDRNLGPVLGHVLTRSAADGLPAQYHQPRIPVRVLARALSRLLLNTIGGRGRPSPFFDANGRPVSEPRILTAAERQRL